MRDKEIKVFNIFSAVAQGYLGFLLSLAVGALIVYLLGWYQYGIESKNPDSFFYSVEKDKKRDKVRAGMSPVIDSPAMEVSLLSGSYACSSENDKLVRKIYDDGYMLDFVSTGGGDYKINVYKLDSVTEKTLVTRHVAYKSSTYRWVKFYGTDQAIDVYDVFVRPEMIAFSLNDEYKPGYVVDDEEVVCEPAGIDTSILDGFKDEALKGQ